MRYCQKTRALAIYAYVFMLNHLHLIVQAPDVAGFVRDFKRHTSKELKKNIERTEPNVLQLFTTRPGLATGRPGATQSDGFQFWKEDNAPKLIETDGFFRQKAKYIHENPVRKGYVERPEYWKWSSANPTSPIEVVRWV